jgi:CheY-like chemotaxis protein
MIINNCNSSLVAKRDSRTQWLHDFNNVLAAIRLQTVLGRIYAGNASPDLLEVLEEIEKGCERAVELLEKLPESVGGNGVFPDKTAAAIGGVGNGPSGPSLVTGHNRLAASGRHGCILLMDDNESLQVSLYKILSGLGYEVETSSSGAECVERLRELHAGGKKVDVGILDLKVPGGIGGVETLARLREIDPQLKAVASTGFSEGDIVANYRRYGFQAALCKPFRIQELVDLLDQLIRPSSCVA